jgi:hypothetical protein
VPPVERWLAPLTRFLHIEAASGVVLVACTAVALTLANSPVADWFAGIWKTTVSLSIGGVTLAGDVGHLIVNDGLMTLFFFVVGLEIKRELVHGEFRDARKALLPVFAALGGVVVPAAIYLALQWGEPGQRGWAIPMATDIAFVVGLLALFGTRVPFGLKILLLSLAIVDDLVELARVSRRRLWHRVRLRPNRGEAGQRVRRRWGIHLARVPEVRRTSDGRWSAPWTPDAGPRLARPADVRPGSDCHLDTNHPGDARW